jgi:hypothetical protein
MQVQYFFDSFAINIKSGLALKKLKIRFESLNDERSVKEGLYQLNGRLNPGLKQVISNPSLNPYTECLPWYFSRTCLQFKFHFTDKERPPISEGHQKNEYRGLF